VGGSTRIRERRALTPAVLASASFTAACAIFAVFFVAGRGGLQMPLAGTQAPVAVGSAGPGVQPSGSPRASVPQPSMAPTPHPTPHPTPPPTEPPVAAPTAVPTPAPSADRTFAIPTLRPNDLLASLPGCPDRPGCYAYVVQRGDTLTGIADRFLVGTLIIEALNPQLTDPSLVVTGQVMYLGLSPFVRLEPCRRAAPCSLYVVASGDSVAGIATTYLLTVADIQAANPAMNRPILVGDVLRLPHPE
jgi:LysM domain